VYWVEKPDAVVVTVSIDTNIIDSVDVAVAVAVDVVVAEAL
jgi:hypothetical protein